MEVAVAGGTGTVGQLVVAVAAERDHEVVVLSRAGGVDLTSVGDLAPCLEGVGAVVDVSGTRAQTLDFARLGPLSVVPRMRIQPVAVLEVAQALVGLVETGPAGRVPDLAGLHVHQLVDLARSRARRETQRSPRAGAARA